MSRSDNSIPEPTIKMLLHDDPPEKLSPDQRARIQARLGLIEKSGPSEKSPRSVMALPHDISATRPPSPPRRNQPA